MGIENSDAVSTICKKYTIGIVVPVYNVSRYLRDCLDSIFYQTVPFDEVVIIEDGSTDDSLVICQEYAMKYPMITLISQSNQGPGASRNKGIARIRCDYIAFLDSDDMISAHMLETVHKHLSGQELLLYSSDIKNELREGNRVNPYIRPNHVCHILMEGVQYLEAIFPQYYIVQPCMGVYKRSFLKDNHIWFPEDVYYEDNSFFVQVINKVKHMECIPDRLYIRRFRENSITTSHITEKHRKDMFEIQRMIWRYLSKETLKHWNVNLLLYFLVSQLNEARTVAELIESPDFSYKKAGLLHEFILCWEKLLARKDLSLSIYVTVIQICDEIKRLYPDVCCRLRDDTYSNLIFSLKRRLNEIPFNDSSKKVGIYGKGNHTSSLCKLYEKLLAPIQSKIIYIETKVNDSNITNISQNTFSYRDIPKDLDALVISSFVYQNDMLRHLKEVGYNEEKVITLYKNYEFIDMVMIDKILG